jgi:ATP-binding cassette subfamily F protein 1
MKKEDAEKEVLKKGVKGVPTITDELKQLLHKNKEYKVNFEFPELDDERPFVEMTNASFRYSGTEKWLFKTLNFGVNTSTRAVIVGHNGSGKTTLLNMLSGEFEPTGGDIRQLGGLRIGRYNQHFDSVLPADESPVAFLLRSSKEAQDKQHMRKLLGRFGLESGTQSCVMVVLQRCYGDVTEMPWWCYRGVMVLLQ